MIPNLILGFKHKMIFHRYHANTNDLPKGLKLRDFLLHFKWSFTDIMQTQMIY